MFRKVPGASSSRAARAFSAASSQYLRGAESLAVGLVYPFTVAGFFKSDIGTGGKTLWSAADLATDNIHWRIEYDELAGNLAVESRTGGVTDQAVVAGVTEDVWNHAGGVYTSSTNRLAYLNGVAGTVNTNASAPAGIDVMSFGGLVRLTTTAFHSGALSTWGIWSVALTASELLLLARGAHPTTIRANALLECWEFNITGPEAGLCRGTILSPVNGGVLTTGPTIVRSRSRLARQVVKASGTIATLTGASAASTWTVPTGALTATKELTGASASLLWTVPTNALEAHKTLSGASALANWIVPTGVLSPVHELVGPSAATVWVVPTGVLSVHKTLTGLSALGTWNVPTGTLAAIVPPKAALYQLFNLTVRLNVKQEVDSGSVLANDTDVSGTVVAFNKAFKDVDSITATALGTTEVKVVVSFTDVPNPTGFSVYAFNAAGARVDATVYWKARGVV